MLAVKTQQCNAEAIWGIETVSADIFKSNIGTPCVLMIFVS